MVALGIEVGLLGPTFDLDLFQLSTRDQLFDQGETKCGRLAVVVGQVVLGGNPERMDRFAEEAGSLLRLGHPHCSDGVGDHSFDQVVVADEIDPMSDPEKTEKVEGLESGLGWRPVPPGTKTGLVAIQVGRPNWAVLLDLGEDAFLASGTFCQPAFGELPLLLHAVSKQRPVAFGDKGRHVGPVLDQLGLWSPTHLVEQSSRVVAQTSEEGEVVSSGDDID